MRPLRRFIIALAEILQVLSLLLWTSGGAWGGMRAARIAFEYGYLRNTAITLETATDAGLVLGGLIGFVLSVTAAALVFTFAQIEVNTREVARYYMERRKSEAAINRVVSAKE